MVRNIERACFEALSNTNVLAEHWPSIAITWLLARADLRATEEPR